MIHWFRILCECLCGSKKKRYTPQNDFTYLLTKYPDKPWDWSGVSRNPNLTVDFINAHPDKPWNWSIISNHKFGNDMSALTYWTQRKEKTIETTSRYKEELLSLACHPERKDMFQWTCDIEMSKRWQER